MATARSSRLVKHVEIILCILLLELEAFYEVYSSAEEKCRFRLAWLMEGAINIVILTWFYVFRIEVFVAGEYPVPSICFWKSLFTSRVFFSSFSHSSLHFLFLAFLGNGSFQIVVARWDPTIRVQTARTETEWLFLGLGLTLNLTTTLTNH